MPLESISHLLDRCREGGFAVGYFESWNLESLQGVIDAAEETKSPVIIGFNGEFLSHAGRLTLERLALYGALGRAAAQAASVPCGLIFNECSDDQWVADAARAGFNLVMPSDPAAPLNDYLTRVKRLVPHCHQFGVAVEAEIDELPCGAADEASDIQPMTDPEVAERFVRETGVDLLAVSVGNVHIKLDGAQDLDLQHLETLCRRVPAALVLHGGTGISADSLREAIALGVAKVNYGTYLKQRYLKAVRRALSTDIVNPHELLGIGGPPDVLVAGRHAVRDAVLERIELLGCCGQAD